MRPCGNVDIVAPHKKNRKKAATQDGRRLRRYKRRFKVERFFSWLEELVVRWEYHAANYIPSSRHTYVDEVFMRYAVVNISSTF